MEIIENTDSRVIRFAVQPPHLWWESQTLPQDGDFTCHIQELGEHGVQNTYLSLRTLQKIVIQAKQERDKVQFEWKFPTTDCCNAHLPRENTNQQFIGETLHITCKPGFGCRKNEKPAEVQERLDAKAK